MKVRLDPGALVTALYHMVVVAVPMVVTQVLAVNGHLDRDIVLSIIGGAVVAAWHNVFPGGLSDVKALLQKVISIRL